MSANDTYLAVFTGSASSPQMLAWAALSNEQQHARGRDGLFAWKAWVQQHQASIVSIGGPLGKTKKVSPQGIEDIANALAGYAIVRADSHEAAAKLFEGHPHFTIFPGDAIEIMPILPIPGE